MRGKPARVRKVLSDYKYNSEVISKFINKVMIDGKKAVAEKNVYEALDLVADITKADPLVVFTKAIENVKPRVEVRARRVGGANYQVPTPVNDRRQQSLAFRWIVDGARARRSATKFSKVLAEELIEAYKNTGNAVKKRDDVHRMADANKAFAHLAWGANAPTSF
ncbi:MAG: 30S ribosomal protein S7 [bacterium]